MEPVRSQVRNESSEGGSSGRERHRFGGGVVTGQEDLNSITKLEQEVESTEKGKLG
jgi:hypothetical protein